MGEHRKKLIEAALPLDLINDAAAYDKLPGIGPHPKGIHQWWARLPLPAARAILFASLVDDPSAHPAEFPTEEDQQRERERLFGILRDLIKKRAERDPAVFSAARREIERAADGPMPIVFDPFSGGGSIPLEGQRLGLEAMGTDLNPVAVLISKAAVEIVPRFLNQPPVNSTRRSEVGGESGWNGSQGLAEDVRHYGEWMRRKAEERIIHLYPPAKLPEEHGGGPATVIAWLWARTAPCPNPACGATMPLLSSLSLSTKRNGKAWLEPAVDRETSPPQIRFDVRSGPGRPPAAPKQGRGATFRCIACGQVAEESYIRDQAKREGLGLQLTSIVAEGERGRVYLPADPEHASIAQSAHPGWKPEYLMPANPRWFSPPLYGLENYGDVFTDRQLAGLTIFSDLVSDARERVVADSKAAGMESGERLTDGGTGSLAYADAVATFLAFSVDRCADFGNSLTGWNPSNEKVMHLFGRQAIPMAWDFGEANLMGSSVGAWSTCNSYIADCIEVIPSHGEREGKISQADASNVDLARKVVVSTDPPYYDNIGYADLSDFFYVWLRRTLREVYPDLFATMLVPKAEELIASPHRFEGNAERARDHFESGFTRAFSGFRHALDDRYPMTVYYAFKQTEGEGSVDTMTGWETLLKSMMSAGLQIGGTWPVRASQKWRMVAMDTNALASYIVLSCRPRSASAGITSSRQFIAELAAELPDALTAMQQGGIAPVDLAQASIGPGMAVFSKYEKVLETDGTTMSVRKALQQINKVLDETLAEQENEFDADTRWAIAWFDQYGMEEGPFGVAETLSRAKNTAVPGLVEAGILRSRAGKVRLISRDELSSSWDPASDDRLTVWEITQQLIRTLDTTGEEAAAGVLEKVGGLGEVARDLAYRLYSICERKGWAQEALAYNTLVTSWRGVKDLAQQKAVTAGSEQTELL